MSDFQRKDIKSVQIKVPGFENYRVRVNAASTIDGEIIGHTVGIMNESNGQGFRTGMDYAEAEAKAVLKAVRKYRKQNPEIFD